MVAVSVLGLCLEPINRTTYTQNTYHKLHTPNSIPYILYHRQPQAIDTVVLSKLIRLQSITEADCFLANPRLLKNLCQLVRARSEPQDPRQSSALRFRVMLPRFPSPSGVDGEVQSPMLRCGPRVLTALGGQVRRAYNFVCDT